jgi:nucleoside 2-deoxyribosyltransferase
MMNNEGFFRPFELLKLIRDKKIKNIREFTSATYLYRYEMHMIASITHRWQRDLQELGLIEVDDSGEISSTDRLSRLFNILNISLTRLTNYSDKSIICSPIFGNPSKPSIKSDIFVVMPFLKELKPVYDDHIRGTVQKMNLTVSRGDDFFTAKSIISDIWNAINSCRIVIADCTGRNPNVFYEIGMAHTLGKPVILISQNKDDIPFDVQYIRYILYEYTPRGMSEFEKKLTSTIESELRDEFSYEMLLAKRKATKDDNYG